MNTFKQLAQKDSNIINAFTYGSHVYGTNHQDSDNDFICIVQDNLKPNQLSQHGDVTNYSVEEFQELIQKHEISVLECLFQSEKFILKEEHDFVFSLHKPTLRTAISAKSSNSWVKCKKKFLVEEDYNPYIGKKSAWHALRIIDFGTQIATQGKIINFNSCNDLLQQIMECNTWEEIDKNFRQTYNQMSSAFKLVAPKEDN